MLLATGSSTRHVAVISKQGNGQVDLLILDSLYKSLEAAKRVQPKCALFVGMVHEFEDESDNAALAEWSKKHQEGIPVPLAYDRQCIPLIYSIRIQFLR
ncbi:unnamed protein product [Sphagnum troendelagicum]|uniref:Uncharacterized protein n=1 Tax=Sphagnum troendelagicum TaxID=128251 RepID=A0ABP0T9S3_9BRYO